MAEWRRIDGTVNVSQASYAILEKYLYRIAGSGTSAYTRDNTTDRLNLETGVWGACGNLVTGRYEHRSISIGNDLYTIGGSGSSDILTSIEKFNTQTLQWSNFGEIARRADFGCANIGNVIYMAGGLLTSSTTGTTDTISTYNVLTKQSGTLSARLLSPRYGCVAVAIGSNIYIIGGTKFVNNTQSAGYDIEVLDTASNTVRKETDLYIRGSVAAAVYKDEIYCFGPSIGFQIYNPENKQWRLGSGGYSGNSRYLLQSEYTFYSCPFYANVGYNYIMAYDMTFTNITSPAPIAGFVNDQLPNRFVWGLDVSPETSRQISAIFQWRAKGESNVHEYPISGSNQFIDIPAYVFPNGIIEWRVQATASNNIQSDWTEWFELTTIDQVHGKPTNLVPASGRKSGSQLIQFSWVMHSYLSTPQKAFEIQYRYSSSTDWMELSGKVISDSPSYILGANMLNPDADFIVTWRVRTYNSDDVPSEWSDSASFLAIIAPLPPSWISVESNTAQPLCRWLSPSRPFAWHLQALSGGRIVYDTEIQPGSNTQHRVVGLLASGPHSFRVRVMNEMHMWSAEESAESWGNEFPVIINSRSRLEIRLTGNDESGIPRGVFTVEVRPD